MINVQQIGKKEKKENFDKNHHPRKEDLDLDSGIQCFFT
jgi:hypothetical protein